MKRLKIIKINNRIFLLISETSSFVSNIKKIERDNKQNLKKILMKISDHH